MCEWNGMYDREEVFKGDFNFIHLLSPRCFTQHEAKNPSNARGILTHPLMLCRTGFWRFSLDLNTNGYQSGAGRGRGRGRVGRNCPSSAEWMREEGSDECDVCVQVVTGGNTFVGCQRHHQGRGEERGERGGSRRGKCWSPCKEQLPMSHLP